MPEQYEYQRAIYKPHEYSGDILNRQIAEIIAEITPPPTPEEARRWREAVKVRSRALRHQEGPDHEWDGYWLAWYQIDLIMPDGAELGFHEIHQAGFEDEPYMQEWGWGHSEIRRGHEFRAAEEFWDRSVGLMEMLSPPPPPEHDAPY